MSHPLPVGLARDVRIVVLDVDGVLTDGGVYIGHGEGGAVEMKRFSILDGLGIRMLAWAGIRVVLVSGRRSAATAERARELDVECYQEGSRKEPVVARLLEEAGAGWEAVAVVADDLADLPLLKKAGLAVAVPNGAAEVRAAARWVTTRPGGHGAVREFAEALLSARGEWARLVDAYVASRERGGDVTEHLGSA